MGAALQAESIPKWVRLSHLAIHRGIDRVSTSTLELTMAAKKKGKKKTTKKKATKKKK